jgi:hypothetical protein
MITQHAQHPEQAKKKRDKEETTTQTDNRDRIKIEVKGGRKREPEKVRDKPTER